MNTPDYTKIVPIGGVVKLNDRLQEKYGSQSGLDCFQTMAACSPDWDPEDRANMLSDMEARLGIRTDDIYEP